MKFEEIYNRLNDEQRQAVDTVDGPLLVLAGPGTGKTQLLSARVANILKQTDASARNILCLTFTEAAALNMRQRLLSMIGEAAYDVQINTYHSFASDIIKSYPDFFESVDLETGEDSRMERPINELGQLEILQQIVERLAFSDPLRNARYYLKSVLSTISDLKQANISPSQLRQIAKENALACQNLSQTINDIYGKHKRIPSKASEAVSLFSEIMQLLKNNGSSLASNAYLELEAAINRAEEINKTKPLTDWKNSWLYKDESDRWCFTDPNLSAKMLSLASIYEAYQKALTSSGQYDFNDMIIKTLTALKDKPELKFNLQERYQYILLDEFQDTNTVQFELVRSLADHPVHEGRPNIMAVGDDDQGIFAFQGADIGNMVQFLSAFRDVKIINLTQNYRSHQNILYVAHNIADQIETRLHHKLEGIDKNIIAAASDLPDLAEIARHEFNSLAAEYGWISDQIAKQIKSGINPSEIAVLAPKHSILESIVPFLNKRGIPVTYEKRENIFETPIVQGILLICEFIEAAKNQHMPLMDELLPRVLSLDFWQIPTEKIWQLNWEHARSSKDDSKRWCERAMDDKTLGNSVKFLLHLGSNSDNYGLELTLDYITGAKPLHYDHSGYTSPLKSYYFSDEALSSSSLTFYEAISHLSVIRSQLRDQQARQDQRLTVKGMLDLYHTYQEAEQPLINTHPIAQAPSSVQLQTVYKAKGLEYEYVYLPCMHDNVWGSSVRGGGNKVNLPPNLKFIRNDSSSEDNLRRLLFVAITRAKYGLIATSHAKSETGKEHLPVRYMQESSEGDTRISHVLPEKYRTINIIEREAEKLNHDVDTLWHSRHTELSPTLSSLLSDRLSRYVMSPTHLNSFTNVEYSGPHQFLLGTLLRFPEAPTPDSIYGDALHRALEKFQKAAIAGAPIDIDQTIKTFETRLASGYMSETDKLSYSERGRKSLTKYLQANGQRLARPAEVEFDFRREGCNLNSAVLTGKIDRLEVNKDDKTLRIIDFKSGNASTKWGNTSKYINYKQQLYFYILLIETSQTYRNYKVSGAALEFIEPLSNGELAPPLELMFNQKEYDEFKLLVESVWQHIQNVNLPDISSYQQSAAGVRSFIKDLIA